MPRTVRNFWIEGETDNGTKFGTGPKSKDGGFTARIFMRHNGEVIGPVRIAGQVGSDGQLHLFINTQLASAHGDVITTHDIGQDEHRITTAR